MPKPRHYMVHTTQGRQIAWSAEDMRHLMAMVTDSGHMVRYVEDEIEYKARTGEDLI